MAQANTAMLEKVCAKSLDLLDRLSSPEAGKTARATIFRRAADSPPFLGLPEDVLPRPASWGAIQGRGLGPG